LKDPRRTWTGVVVGEGTRCWFGNQFSLIAPRFAAYGVELWVPELGGRFDPRNPSHKMLMSVLGGMSESERQHVQARVRAAMDTQVVNEGRHQGGRAPYGYVVVDGGPHPNPRKAAEGHRLRVLAVDDATADVVRRIFAEKLDGAGDQTIAGRLNRDGVPCPSMRWPDQNRHRLADGWQASAVRAILDNPRYTGYAFFGRWKKHEELLDPDDVAAGHVTRFRRAEPSKVVRSRMPAHPAIVSVETFTEARMMRRARAAGGLQARRKLDRGQRKSASPYSLRGRVRCGHCGRRMEGTSRGPRIYYRCAARSIVPGSAVLATHPKIVYLPENAVVGPLNAWIGGLFAPDRREDTVRRLLDADGTRADTARSAAADKALADAEQRLRRLHAAIEAGVDPVALIDPINRAQEELEAARFEQQRLPTVHALGQAEVKAMLDHIGDVGAALQRADPAKLEELYRSLGLEMTYRSADRLVEVTVQPRVVSERVRGGTCALTTRLRLP
jgi:hypothetical protein